jgi:hypothetical protein
MSDPTPRQINVSAEPEDLKGRYANLCTITSQERDVVIDFISLMNTPERGEGRLVSRIFLNRFTAQELVNALQQNLTQWEKMRYAAPTEGAADVTKKE